MNQILFKSTIKGILSNIAKMDNYKFYSTYQCCRTCFWSEKKEDNLVLLNHCNNGMNKQTLEEYEKEVSWYIYFREKVNYSELCKKLNNKFGEQLIKAVAICPEDKSKAIEVRRFLE